MQDKSPSLTKENRKNHVKLFCRTLYEILFGYFKKKNYKEVCKLIPVDYENLDNLTMEV